MLGFGALLDATSLNGALTGEVEAFFWVERLEDAVDFATLDVTFDASGLAVATDLAAVDVFVADLASECAAFGAMGAALASVFEAAFVSVLSRVASTVTAGLSTSIWLLAGFSVTSEGLLADVGVESAATEEVFDFSVFASDSTFLAAAPVFLAFEVVEDAFLGAAVALAVFLALDPGFDFEAASVGSLGASSTISTGETVSSSLGFLGEGGRSAESEMTITSEFESFGAWSSILLLFFSLSTTTGGFCILEGVGLEVVGEEDEGFVEIFEIPAAAGLGLVEDFGL